MIVFCGDAVGKTDRLRLPQIAYRNTVNFVSFSSVFLTCLRRRQSACIISCCCVVLNLFIIEATYCKKIVRNASI